MPLIRNRGLILRKGMALARSQACCCPLCPALNVVELFMDAGQFYPTTFGPQPTGFDPLDYGYTVQDPVGSLYPWKRSSIFETFAGGPGGPEAAYYRSWYWTFYTCGNPDETALHTAFKQYIEDIMGPLYPEHLFVIVTPSGPPDINVPAGIPVLVEHHRGVDHPGAAEDPRYAQTNFFDDDFGAWH